MCHKAAIREFPTKTSQMFASTHFSVPKNITYAGDQQYVVGILSRSERNGPSLKGTGAKSCLPRQSFTISPRLHFHISKSRAGKGYFGTYPCHIMQSTIAYDRRFVNFSSKFDPLIFARGCVNASVAVQGIVNMMWTGIPRASAQ